MYGITSFPACLTLLLCPMALAAQSSPRAQGESWSATWDLVGTGFDDGFRTAVLTTERHDEDCACQVQGPPGGMVASGFSRDTLYITWDFGTDEQMYVDLHLEGDHLAGAWRMGTERGEIVGTRRP